MANFKPYSKQSITDADVAAVTAAMRDPYLTTGPKIEEFESALAGYVGAKHAIVLNNGTSALRLSYQAAGAQSGQTLVTTPLTFAATASAAKQLGLNVEFVDTGADGLMCPTALERRLQQGGVDFIVPVHLAGQACQMAAIADLACQHDAIVIEDACHALGGLDTDGENQFKVGSCAHSLAANFSFHPVKPLTTLEGGAITTNDDHIAAMAKQIRHHGITRDPAQWQNREIAFDCDGNPNPWYHEVAFIGSNERLTDVQCALGLSQLQRLPAMVEQRTRLAATYDAAFATIDEVMPVPVRTGIHHARHLYPVLINFEKLGLDKASFMRALADAGVGTQVHYIPVPAMPAYGDWQSAKRDFPNAWQYYEQTLSLPLYPDMEESSIQHVTDSIATCLQTMAQ